MKLIDKDAVVAEIERLITPENGYSMDKLLDFIDTLEVKNIGTNDTFIEKARKWFQKSEHFDFNGIRRYGNDDFDDFIKYIEGEL